MHSHSIKSLSLGWLFGIPSQQSHELKGNQNCWLFFWGAHQSYSYIEISLSFSYNVVVHLYSMCSVQHINSHSPEMPVCHFLSRFLLAIFIPVTSTKILYFSDKPISTILLLWTVLLKNGMCVFVNLCVHCPVSKVYLKYCISMLFLLDYHIPSRMMFGICQQF